MKLSAMFLVLAMGLLFFGAAHAFAAEGGYGSDQLAMMRQCELDFQRMDIGDRGYITYNDFRHEWEGHSRIGPAPSGNAYSAWTSIRSDDPQRVTQREFCMWRGR